MGEFGRGLERLSALQYAYVIASQSLTATDRDAARGLLAAVLDAHGESGFDRLDAELLLHLALKERDFETVDRVLDTMPLRRGVRQLGQTDAVNPWIRPGCDEATWLAALNENLYGGVLLPVALRSDGETPFDRLTAGAFRPVTHERRITVVMSCYNPDRHLLTAVRSVVEQTWQNFELLIVDDASTAPEPGVLEATERMDGRVRVIRKSVNGGTYRARNMALRQATGDFFTCVDSDDWIHPQRLELSVAPLLSDPALIATRGSGVRATPEVEFSRIGRGGRMVASSSLMVRTFPGLIRLGFFDSVRKAADNEYAMRLEAAFGGSIVTLPRHALTVLLSHDASLSASDFAPGWRHGARSEYTESQERFHREIREGQRSAFLDPNAPRPFPAPRRWERHPEDGEPPGALDLCVIADWRSECADEAIVDYLSQVASRGGRVGVVHTESLHVLRAVADPITPVLRELIATGSIERIYLDDVREIRRLVIGDPRPFQFPDEVAVRLNPGRLQVRSMAVAEALGQYDAETVGKHLRGMFGVSPTWHGDLLAPAFAD
ncbi:glycosyltransferase family 2 protein [Pseudactinotalea sp. Z1748]|uniref:glycosyltransferase family 2 protein n=1 Tax=Pseudactinotalea sp. Z1748 TaxID=3413027 RepID=UPI003C7BC6BE